MFMLLLGIAMAEPSCDREAKDFAGVVSLGDFAHDLGCIPRGVRIGEAEGTLSAMTPPGLSVAGWQTADEAQKHALARAWTTQVALAHSRPVTRASDGRTFPPLAVSTDGDQIVVQLWVAGEATESETRYHHYQLRYAVADGAVEGPTALGSHSVSFFDDAPHSRTPISPD